MWFIIGTCISVLMLAIGIIFFVVFHQNRVIKYQLELQKINREQQSQLIQAAVQSEEMERKRISSELHDEVGALLSTIKLYLNQVQPENFKDAGKITTLINCKELLDETISTIRNISVNLQPATIKDFGLEGTMQIFCDKLNKSSAINASLTLQGLHRLDVETELAIFRILQELTNNIIKHANAKKINYSIIQKEDALQIFIEHNGDGLNQQTFQKKLYKEEGLGLKNIQNRLNILKGNIHFEKSDTNIYTIFLQFPFIKSNTNPYEQN